MKLNELVNLQIDDLAMGGEGVGKASGLAVFVPHSVPGDEVKVKLTLLKKNYARGEIVELIKPSPDRVKPPCPLFPACGGCQWQHISYPAQLKYKTKIVKEALTRIGHLGKVKVNDVMGMEEPHAFRNKFQYSVGTDGKRLTMGYYRKGTHEVIDIDDCLVLSPDLNKLAVVIKKVLNKHGYAVYDSQTKEGLFNVVVGRVGRGAKEVVLALVTAQKDIPQVEDLIKDLVSTCREQKINLIGITQDVESKQNNIVLGAEQKVLWGRNHLYDQNGEIKFKVSLSSFYQTNLRQTDILYDQVFKMAEVSKNDAVIDAYAGVGSLALKFAPLVKEILTIEENRKAMQDAAASAKQNNIENCRFMVGQVEKVLPNFIDETDVLVLDPPRTGCHKRVLTTIIPSAVKKIIYVSCNPATLARDLWVLFSGGYRVEEVQPIDMFPHSFHVEVVVKLVR